MNVWFNAVRRQFGLPYWSLSAYIKHRVKNAVAFISHYEEVVAHAARERGVDGVVCGHIHSAEIRDFDGVLYMNDGDWVESCTALVEHFDGRIEIINWAHHTAALKAQATPPTAVKAVEALRVVEPA
jgi:UDP-2,3-diacylglucosamine pyrophosphatase LpxH